MFSLSANSNQLLTRGDVSPASADEDSAEPQLVFFLQLLDFN